MAEWSKFYYFLKRKIREKYSQNKKLNIDQKFVNADSCLPLGSGSRQTIGFQASTLKEEIVMQYNVNIFKCCLSNMNNQTQSRLL